jgi:hypothetical protein
MFVKLADIGTDIRGRVATPVPKTGGILCAGHIRAEYGLKKQKKARTYGRNRNFYCNGDVVISCIGNF